MHALAPDAAGADGNEALGYLITDGLPVGRRVPPGPDTVFLVIMTKEIKGQAYDDEGRKNGKKNLLTRPVPVIERDAAAKEHERRRHKEYDGRAGIGLEQDDSGQEQGRQEAEQAEALEELLLFE